MLKESKAIQKDQLEDGKVYVQITNVEPFEDDDEMEEEEQEGEETQAVESPSKAGVDIFWLNHTTIWHLHIV